MCKRIRFSRRIASVLVVLGLCGTMGVAGASAAQSKAKQQLNPHEQLLVLQEKAGVTPLTDREMALYSYLLYLDLKEKALLGSLTSEEQILYRKMVHRYEVQGENQEFCVAAPANNNCATATVVNLSTTAAFQECIDTEGANNQGGEAAASCAPSGHSVWYKVTAPANGLLVLGSLGSGSPDRVSTDYDTVISVYNTTTCLPTAGQEVACNDDVVSGVDLRSQVKVPVTANQTLLVRVAGYSTESGMLCVRFVYTPR